MFSSFNIVLFTKLLTTVFLKAGMHSQSYINCDFEVKTQKNSDTEWSTNGAFCSTKVCIQKLGINYASQQYRISKSNRVKGWCSMQKMTIIKMSYCSKPCIACIIVDFLNQQVILVVRIQEIASCVLPRPFTELTVLDTYLSVSSQTF